MSLWCMTSKIKPKYLLGHVFLCDSILFLVLKQIVTTNEKWILYNNAGRKKQWGKWDRPPQTTTKVWFSFIEGDAVYIMRLEVTPLLWPLLKNPTTYSNMYRLQLDELKVENDEKLSELCERKSLKDIAKLRF